jgi:hypothetical protein
LAAHKVGMFASGFAFSGTAEQKMELQGIHWIAYMPCPVFTRICEVLP